MYIWNYTSLGKWLDQVSISDQLASRYLSSPETT